MRLLMVTTSFAPMIGGISYYAGELGKRLVKRCEEFAVVAPELPGGAEVDPTLPYRVRRISGPLQRSLLEQLPAILEEGRFDTVFHTNWFSAPASLWARGIGRDHRVFCATHGTELLFEFAEQGGQILRELDGVIAVSRYTKSLLERFQLRQERVRIVYCGVDSDAYRPATPSFRAELGLGTRPVLLTLSRMVPRKGLDSVLRVLPRVLERVPDLVYLVGGDGEDRERLVALAAECQVQDRVRFLGSIPGARMAELYSSADLFVLPSREEPPSVEGFGLVFLEAGACGIPVIGARAGGVVEAIEHDVTGRCVEPSDLDALAHSIVELLLDRDLARRMGEAGRQRARRFSWDSTVEAMMAMMTENPSSLAAVRTQPS